MKPERIAWRRISSCLLALAMLLILMPATAFAAGYSDYQDAAIIALHRTMTADNTSVTTTTLNPKDADGNYKLSPANRITTDAWPADKRENDVIDVYVTSTDMTDEEKASYAIPYVLDNDNDKWYLYQIMWANNSTVNDGETTETVMTWEQVKQAAAAQSGEAYKFDLNAITVDSLNNNRYYIRYCWTQVDPALWGTTIAPPTPPTEYTVKYDTNEGIMSLPGSRRIDPVCYDEKSGTAFLYFTEGGASSFNFLSEEAILETDNQSVYTIGDNRYRGALVTATAADGTMSYYQFTGWLGEDGETYQSGAKVTPTSELAGGDNEITFTAQWSQITPFTEDQIKKAEEELPLKVFYTRANSENVLLTQSVNGAEATGESVKMTENDTISYNVSALVDGGLLAHDVNVGFNGAEFATFTIDVTVDKNLQFANVDNDGNVTIGLDSDYMELTGITLADGALAPTITGTAITFAPDDLPVDSDGNLVIQISAAWKEGLHQNYKMNLTGLEFELKDGVGVVSEIKTSANISAKFDLAKMADWDSRARYQVVYNYLRYDGPEGEERREYFGGGVEDPTAYLHALQFVDYKLADYSLKDDVLSDMKANTCVAKGAFTITATAGEHGSIDPAGTVTVARNDSAAFTITPDSGYKIADVKVDGKSVGAVSSYTFEDVTADHTIEATFQAASTGGSHTHNYVWQHSPDEHWQYCADCGSVISNGPHTFQWKTDSNGNHYQECTVCGYRIAAGQSGDAGTAEATPAPAATSAPATPAATSAAVSVPQTSDDMPVGALTALAAAAAAAFVALLVVRKRRHGED